MKRKDCVIALRNVGSTGMGWERFEGVYMYRLMERSWQEEKKRVWLTEQGFGGGKELYKTMGVGFCVLKDARLYLTHY